MEKKKLISLVYSQEGNLLLDDYENIPKWFFNQLSNKDKLYIKLKQEELRNGNNT